MFIKLIKIISTLTVTTLILASLAYLAIGWNDIPFDDKAKSEAPGQFIKLTAGYIHYNWVEPKADQANGDIVVMSHGYGVPGFMFNQVARMLADNGFKVLLFDHFGHGYSERPSVVYDKHFFDNELSELLLNLKIDKPVILVGQSMGGLIAANFAAKHPDQIKKLVLFVPAGLRMHQSEDSSLIELLDKPLLGKWIWRIFGRASMKEENPPPCDLCGKGRIEGNLYTQAQYEGFFEAMRDIFIQFPMNKQDSVYVNLGKTAMPIISFFGEKDKLVMPISAEIFKSLVPKSEVVLLPNGDHALHIRHWQVVGEKLLDWLGSTGNK